MAHLLRGKQTGIKSDLSLGLGVEQFAIDQVLAMLEEHHPGLLIRFALGNTIWHQLSTQRYIIRSGSISSRCWDQ